jgi:pSer/pThr/pTyr-binding forkhead associated (FHA) protein
VIRLTAVIEVEGHAPRALTHESNARSIVIGRDGTADFQLPLSTISRHHARIGEADNVYTLEDLGSTHGTAINGNKMDSGQKKVLRHGDIIEITKAKITCAIETEKVASAEPGEGTQAIASRAVQGILGRLGEAKSEGPYLRIIHGAGEGTRFSLTGATSEWTLGRSRDCECVLPDPNVSRRHASIKKDWNGFVVHDLGSKNGVQVGDQNVTRPRRLKDRDEITVGPIRLVFVDPDADLLAALKDVPGFGPEDEPEPMDPAASHVGAPQGLEQDLEDFPPGQPDGALQEPAARSEEDELAAIDPELLANARPRLPTDALVMGGVALLAVGAAATLFYLLG